MNFYKIIWKILFSLSILLRMFHKLLPFANIN